MRLDGRPLAPISLAGSEADAVARPERSQAAVITVAKGLPDGPHMLELVNDGAGEVTLAGFVLDRPQKGSEPDYSRESPELAAETRRLPPARTCWTSPAARGCCSPTTCGGACAA